MMGSWSEKTLGDIATVKGGKRVPKGYKLQSTATNHPYITVSDFNDEGSVDQTGIQYISDEVFEQIKRYTISVDDLYISIAGTIGKTGIVPDELDGANLTENACKLVFNKGVDKRYVYYFTRTADFTEQAGLNTRTAAQPKLALERLKTIRLKVPDYSEQQRIVALLDEALAGIATATWNAKKNLQNARELFECHLQSILTTTGDGWVEKTLGDVCEIRSGRNQTEIEKANGKYPILGSAGKPMGFTDHFICEEGTTLVGRKGTIDNPLFIGTKFWNVDTAFGLHAINGLDKRFLFYFCRSYDFTKNDKGSGRPSLVKTDLLQIKVPLPPLTEQQRIVAQLDTLATETKRLEAIYQQKLDNLAALKQSILQKAFAGELHTDKLAA